MEIVLVVAGKGGGGATRRVKVRRRRRWRRGRLMRLEGSEVDEVEGAAGGMDVDAGRWGVGDCVRERRTRRR